VGHARPLEPPSKVMFEYFVDFGDKFPQDGSKNEVGMALEGSCVLQFPMP
jgi:hypothetical protein